MQNTSCINMSVLPQLQRQLLPLPAHILSLAGQACSKCTRNPLLIAGQGTC